MVVALFNGTGVPEYCGAPKGKQSQQSLGSLALVSLRSQRLALITGYRRGSKRELTLEPGSYSQQAEPDFLEQR